MQLPLTQNRTFAALPFACRYRLVDFPISSMVNAGISNINVIANYNYRSLIQHIGSGKDWDLARYTGGVHIMSPYQNAGRDRQGVYSTRREALLHMKDYIESMGESIAILSDCNCIANLDYRKMLETHIKNEAEVTIAVSENITGQRGEDGSRRLLPVCILSCSLLRQWLSYDGTGDDNLPVDILKKETTERRICTYTHSGYVAKIESMEDYFYHSIALTRNPEVAESLFGNGAQRILTRTHNSTPTRYGERADVIDSLVADGCLIEGRVENSIVFRNVRIGRGSVVRNSILFAGTEIGSDTVLDCVICDKKVKIGSERILSGHITMPMYIQKGREV